MGAPKGNKYAEGNTGGRPAIFKPSEADKVLALVLEYFEWIKGEYEEQGEGKDKKRVCIRNPEPPTVTGLTIHLGFSSKSTLYEYAKRKEFSYSIKRGLTAIEKYHEIQVSGGDKCTGNIFILKNFGWKDKSEVVTKNLNYDSKELTKEDMKEYEESLENDF